LEYHSEEPPSVAVEKALATFDRYLVQPVRDRWQNDASKASPSMQVIAPLFELAEWSAVFSYRQHGAAGEVDTDADHSSAATLADASAQDP